MIYRDIREYFPSLQIVGWFLGGPGFLLEDIERQKKIQEDNFGGGDKILLKMDSIEKEQKIFCYKEGELQELSGYYVYYEKNTEMQHYMADAKELPVERVTEPEYRKAEPASVTVPEKTVAAGYSTPPKGVFFQLFYATGGILTCLAILVIAGLVMQIQERNELKELLNQQEKLVSSLQKVHVVEEGETIEMICMEIYGSAEREEAIRILNGLSEGEEPEAGQKIFLP